MTFQYICLGLMRYKIVKKLSYSAQYSNGIMLVVNGVVKDFTIRLSSFHNAYRHNGRKHLARVTGNSAGCFCYS